MRFIITFVLLVWLAGCTANDMPPVDRTASTDGTGMSVEKKGQAEKHQDLAKSLATLNKQLADVLDDPHIYFAPIDKAFVRKLVNVEGKNRTLIVKSPGGDAQYGYRAARIIYEEGHKLIITEYCSSACAEFLLPAAKSLVFDKSPLIGFHGSPLTL